MINNKLNNVITNNNTEMLPVTERLFKTYFNIISAPTKTKLEGCMDETTCKSS